MSNYRFCAFCSEAVEITETNQYANEVFCDTMCEQSRFRETTNGFYDEPENEEIDE